jgi:hypothetical protein
MVPLSSSKRRTSLVFPFADITGEGREVSACREAPCLLAPLPLKRTVAARCCSDRVVQAAAGVRLLWRWTDRGYGRLLTA